MNFLRTHPILDAIAVAGSLLIIGTLFIRTQIAAPVHVTTDSTWGGANGVYVDMVSKPGGSLSQAVDTGPGTTAKDIGLIPLATQNEIGTGPQDMSDGFSLEQFAAMLTQPVTQAAGAEPADTSAYSFIPSGLIATTTLTKPRSSLQNTLYLYGNEVGDAITSFEGLHPNQPSVLKNHAEQPEDPDAKAALKALGEDFARLGDSIGKIETPKQAATANAALSAAYVKLGTSLVAVSQASGNDNLYDAIVAYDATADDFAKKFVSLALIFQSYAVTFSPGDGGSVFVFPSSGL
jgi:hypothetical protein